MAKKKANLSRLTTDALQKEIGRREKQVGAQIMRMCKKREGMREELADLESQIIEMGGKLSGLGGRKRPKNDFKLSDALVRVLKTKTMSVTRVAEAVQSAGYKTTSPNFRTIVNQTLLKDSRFKRVSRGQYTAK